MPALGSSQLPPFAVMVAHPSPAHRHDLGQVNITDSHLDVINAGSLGWGSWGIRQLMHASLDNLVVKQKETTTAQ